MKPKPRHLAPEYGSVFQDPTVVSAYRYRPPYPPETFDILVGLMDDPDGAVLDMGCGSGLLARPLAARVGRVDAVDPSAAMLDAARRAPGGDNPRIRWIHAPMETAPLDPPYALATAGDSLHWMEWGEVLPRLAGTRLAILTKLFSPEPWDEELAPLKARYSTNQEYEPYDLLEELTSRGLFVKEGESKSPPMSFTNPIDDYVESFHSTSGFSRERMTREDAAEFDAEVRRIVLAACPDGTWEITVTSWVVWGRPLPAIDLDL